jgi:ferrous iron transport protein A
VRSAIPLEQLRPGQAARISRVSGPAEDVHRLEEFGLRDGSRVEMFRPGNPCILRLGGVKVCIRAGRQLRVYVVPVK